MLSNINNIALYYIEISAEILIKKTSRRELKAPAFVFFAFGSC